MIMHNFHTKISTLNNISRGTNYTALTINYKLVETGSLEPFMSKAVVPIP